MTMEEGNQRINHRRRRWDQRTNHRRQWSDQRTNQEAEIGCMDWGKLTKIFRNKGIQSFSDLHFLEKYLFFPFKHLMLFISLDSHCGRCSPLNCGVAPPPPFLRLQRWTLSRLRQLGTQIGAYIAELWCRFKCYVFVNCQNVSRKWKVFVLQIISNVRPGAEVSAFITLSVNTTAASA